jgi:hypothetical protein
MAPSATVTTHWQPSAAAVPEVQMVRSLRGFILTALALVGAIALSTSVSAQGMHTSRQFTGSKVNAGTVTHVKENGREVLKLSADFKVPDTPDPHWQVVDSKGQVFLLQRLGIKGDKVNTQIVLPAYVKDIAKVQIYCAWAEVVLGETTFERTISTN